MYDRELRIERSSPEEKRHEALRVTLTYTCINVVSIVFIHLSISPVVDPHRFDPVSSSKAGLIAFRVFSGIWAIITAFYNCVLGCYAFRLMLRKWKEEEAAGHLNTYRTPRDGREEEERREEAGSEAAQSSLWDENNVPGTAMWFANNNPYTAARRTHSGAFAAARRSKRLLHTADQYQIHTDHEPILEESTDGDCNVDAEEWSDDKIVEEEPEEITFPNLVRARALGSESVARHADSYPFSRGEEATSSTTTWSNSATSAGELARKKNMERERKKRRSKKKDDKKAEEMITRVEKMGPTALNGQSSGEGSFSMSATTTSEVSGDPKSPTGTGERDAANDGSERRSHRSSSRASDRSEPETDPQRERTRMMKSIISHGSYRDQQAAFHHLNHAIWAEVGDNMTGQIQFEQPAPVEPANGREDPQSSSSSGSSGTGPKTKWWDLTIPLPQSRRQVNKTDPKPKEAPKAKDGSAQARKEKWNRRYILACIILACTIMTFFPPFLVIGGELIAHDYQFQHACDNVRWDIKLDASGLHPEQDNVYNRAIFKDRRGKGFEKEFMMNLEGMSSYNDGLDRFLVNGRRGYVFYLSRKDLEHQPDNGESVKFPYPVVVAYDMLKHAYYAHDDVWKDLNDERFFDNGAFMNGTVGVFPSEGIWLEKKERDGYCGQPKRLLKNSYDQRILWTVVDDRRDCTMLRVCGSSKATRRQVVVATGMLLLRLAMSATCCSKTAETEPVGS
ncbi:hypothetical protein DRE_00705 [Drechslerella stenobrocha 248]|uniref:Uncharacterized protein n=1 Tax=Drechslerella stenobrocha 248 TaxID=1043628 RepID=W7HMS0_9PEZI|nr:hypothetical protein DRE_00705 [Drechslerella stenobrocha 248]